MGSKGGGNAPSPDPAIGAAAMKQATTGEAWLGFAKDQFKVSSERQKGLDAQTKQITDLQIGAAKDQLSASREDRARYKQKFLPIEDKFIKDATNYGSAENQEAQAATAAGDIQSASADARETARREQAAIGVTPGSGRWAAADRAGEMGQALGVAGAKNQARGAVRDKGLALQADVVNLGRGLPAQSAQAASVGLSAAGGAGQLGQANQSTFNSNAQGVHSGFGGAMQGYAGQANTLTNLYGMELDKWKTKMEASSNNVSGIASAIGSVAGMAVGFSSRKAKKNIKKVKEGDGIKAIKKMPISTYDYKPGLAGGTRGHIGTMSDHYAKATGDKDSGGINLQDAIGITMKAVQDLDRKIDKLGGKSKSKPKAKTKTAKPPAARRSSQSPAKARAGPPKNMIHKPKVKPLGVSTLGIGR